MRNIGLIGYGAIGRPVADAIHAGLAGSCRLAGVLTRTPVALPGALFHTDPERFFALPADLYLETAGPAALAGLGGAALALADVWSVSGAALANDALRERLREIGQRTGHRLRLVSGAIGGLDAVTAMSIDPDAQTVVHITAPEIAEAFSGTAREAAARFPDGANVAAAAALSGTGLDRTSVHLAPGAGPRSRQLRVSITSAFGSFNSSLKPSPDPGRRLHVAAASLIAALRQAEATIWIG